jgi:hypothetical protein
MADEVDTKQIWKSLGSAIGVEVREATTIPGISGQDHPVQAVGVDDKAGRVVIFSAEPSPPIAALMQTDVQATLPDAKVLVARPVIFDLSEIARRVVATSDIQSLTTLLKQLGTNGQQKNEELNRTIGPAIKPLFDAAARVRLPFAVQVMDIVEQITNMDWQSTLQAPSLETFLSTVLSMTTIDSAAADRQLGICPIPLYDFSEADYELLLSGKDIDELRARLKALGIYQYFFPAPDQLLLGLADKQVTKDGSLVLAAEQAPPHGHPLGDPELLKDPRNLLETLEELKGIGYVADAEFGLEITEKGRSVRQTINVRPREGLINKISKIVSVKVNISLKDLK